MRTAVTREQLALLSLWAIPKLGVRSLEALAKRVPGFPEAILDLAPADWAPTLDLPPEIRQSLLKVQRLAVLGERVLERAAKAGMGIAFQLEPEYPDQLKRWAGAPPLLFFLGRPRPPRRRVAMVGCRGLDNGFESWIESFSEDVALGGVGVVSGAALGADQAAHRGALKAGGETLAFLGSALDQIDAAQRPLVRLFLDGWGVLYSELPPHVRANKQTFPLRNRLIAGASDAVIVLRAGEKSGSLYTAEAAHRMGRLVLAVPGDVRNEVARGCNLLLSRRMARACLEASDVFEAVGVTPETKTGSARPVANLKDLSAAALNAYEALARTPRSFDQVLQTTGMVSGALTSALCELELMGLVLQRPGKRYERI